MTVIQNLTEDQMTLLVIKALKEGKKTDFQKLLEELHPYDMATIYKNLPEKHKLRFLLQLNIPVLTDMIQELGHEEQLEVLKKLGREKSRKVLDDMDNDDLASLLDDMSPERIKSFLSGMKKKSPPSLKT